MDKESIKRYLIEAIDALDDSNLDFKKSEGPDMYTFAGLISALTGEVKKMNNVSLKLNNEVHQIIEESKQQKELQRMLEGAKTLDKDLSEILFKLIEINDLNTRTEKYFKQLPQLVISNYFKFVKAFKSWEPGYNMEMQKWNNLMASIGLKKTGLAGETFNPEIHQAMALVQDNSLKENTIKDTIEPGYFFKDMLLKQAKVTVIKNS